MAKEQPEAMFAPVLRRIQFSPGATVPAEVVANYLVLVQDISLGVRTIMELSERAAFDKVEEVATVLDDFHLGNLQRLAIRAAQALEEETASMEATLRPPKAQRGA